jgi:hypothetical protein
MAPTPPHNHPKSGFDGVVITFPDAGAAHAASQGPLVTLRHTLQVPIVVPLQPRRPNGCALVQCIDESKARRYCPQQVEWDAT